MTKQEKQKRKLAEKMVSKFITNFREAIGVKPMVKYSIENDYPSLNEIFNVVNKYYKLRVKNDEFSICDKNRDDIITNYRYIYFSIGKEFNYTFNDIGKLVNKDHSTVHTGASKVLKTNQLKIKIMKELNYEK